MTEGEGVKKPSNMHDVINGIGLSLRKNVRVHLRVTSSRAWINDVTPSQLADPFTSIRQIPLKVFNFSSKIKLERRKNCLRLLESKFCKKSSKRV